MGLLSNVDILKAIESKELMIEPFEESLVQPSSVDVRLDRKFLLFNSDKYAAIDPRVEQVGLTREVWVGEDKPFTIHPRQFVLASTYECVTLRSRLAGRVEGKSSLGRLGLLVHSTAGFIDPGFCGSITLELSNISNLPILLWPGMQIGQICLLSLDTEASILYGSERLGSHYQGQRGPTPSRSWQRWKTWPLS